MVNLAEFLFSNAFIEEVLNWKDCLKNCSGRIWHFLGDLKSQRLQRKAVLSIAEDYFWWLKIS